MRASRALGLCRTGGAEPPLADLTPDWAFGVERETFGVGGYWGGSRGFRRDTATSSIPAATAGRAAQSQPLSVPVVGSTIGGGALPAPMVVVAAGIEVAPVVVDDAVVEGAVVDDAVIVVLVGVVVVVLVVVVLVVVVLVVVVLVVVVLVVGSVSTTSNTT
jgi:hypothetical protein